MVDEIGPELSKPSSKKPASKGYDPTAGEWAAVAALWAIAFSLRLGVLYFGYRWFLAPAGHPALGLAAAVVITLVVIGMRPARPLAERKPADLNDWLVPHAVTAMRSASVFVVLAVAKALGM